MKTLLALLLGLTTAALTAPSAHAVGNNFGGLKNVKVVMPGVLYRGGGAGGRVPMGPAQLDALCESGFSNATYAYKTGWTGSQNVSCGSNRISYDYRQWDNSGAVKTTLRDLHDIIRSGSGAMYVHCWYGVHASGYVAAVALAQFCDYSPEQAVEYWKKHVPTKLQYPKVIDMIRKFQPYKEFEISAGERARVCP